MDHFPSLQNSQVAVIQAQHSTGIVLDKNFKYADSQADPNIFLVFNDLNIAKGYIDAKKGLIGDVEFVVYDKNQEVILYVAPPGSFFSENPPPFMKKIE